MDKVQLNTMPAISHSWRNNSASFMVSRLVKTLVNGVRAFFGGYSVTKADAEKFILNYPDARATAYLQKELDVKSVRHHKPASPSVIHGFEFEKELKGVKKEDADEVITVLVERYFKDTDDKERAELKQILMQEVEGCSTEKINIRLYSCWDNIGGAKELKFNYAIKPYGE